MATSQNEPIKVTKQHLEFLDGFGVPDYVSMAVCVKFLEEEFGMTHAVANATYRHWHQGYEARHANA